MEDGHPILLWQSLYMINVQRGCGMERFDTILWDVDQTLLDFKRSEDYAVRYCFRLFGLEADDRIVKRYSEINEGYWKRIETGEIRKKEALTGRFQTLFREIGVTDVDAEEFQEVYAEALGSVYYFQDNSYELVKSLKGVCRQYLVTNGVNRTQRKKLQLSGLDRLVDGIFVSEQMGVPKPQKEYFEKCFARIPGFCKEHTVIVGDSLTSDMLGGNRAGIATCWYNPEGMENHSEVRIDYEIRNLNEIRRILGIGTDGIQGTGNGGTACGQIGQSEAEAAVYR